MAFVLALIIRTFLFQAFFIPSPSMEPTLQEGDRVLVNKIPYYFHDPRRGDIIVFENPNPEAAHRSRRRQRVLPLAVPGLGFQQPENEDFIKRVIGLPGDVVRARHGDVYVNGEKLEGAVPHANDPGVPAEDRSGGHSSSSWATTAGTRWTLASAWGSCRSTRSSARRSS